MMSDEVLHYAYINQPSSSDQERAARRKGRTSNRDTHHNNDNRSSLSLLLSSLSLRTQAVVISHVRVACDGEDGPGVSNGEEYFGHHEDETAGIHAVCLAI
jgi:hypothetical protein